VYLPSPFLLYIFSYCLFHKKEGHSPPSQPYNEVVVLDVELDVELDVLVLVLVLVDVLELVDVLVLELVLVLDDVDVHVKSELPNKNSLIVFVSTKFGHNHAIPSALRPPIERQVVLYGEDSCLPASDSRPVFYYRGVVEG